MFAIISMQLIAYHIIMEPNCVPYNFTISMGGKTSSQIQSGIIWNGKKNLTNAVWGMFCKILSIFALYKNVEFSSLISDL